MAGWSREVRRADGAARGDHRVSRWLLHPLALLSPSPFPGPPRHPFTLDEHRHPTVERCYQARKAADPTDHDLIRDIGTTAEAKRLGREIVCVPDRERRKTTVMRHALAARFAPGSDAAAFLLGSGYAPLVEGNDWDDTFSGVCNGRGRNTLGVLLTERRSVLRQELSQR